MKKISILLAVFAFALFGFNISTTNAYVHPACSDGIDNDGDGFVDFGPDLDGNGYADAPADPFCFDAEDNSEYIPFLECSSGEDEDGDGFTDMEDPGCSSPMDQSEFNLTICNDDIDNDGDGLFDFPADPGCTALWDTNEFSSTCFDGLDNDTDGLIDFPADPGCTSIEDTDEYNIPGPATNIKVTLVNIDESVTEIPGDLNDTGIISIHTTVKALGADAYISDNLNMVWDLRIFGGYMGGDDFSPITEIELFPEIITDAELSANGNYIVHAGETKSFEYVVHFHNYEDFPTWYNMYYMVLKSVYYNSNDSVLLYQQKKVKTSLFTSDTIYLPN